MSSPVEESISTICVILSFLCSLDIMCHPCLHNSQVPDPASFASHTDHKSESTAHKSCATEHWIKGKQPLGRSCRTSLGLGAAEVSPEHTGMGTGPAVLSSKCPLVRCLGQALPSLLLLSGPFQAHLYSHATYMDWTEQLLHHVPVIQSVNILSEEKHSPQNTQTSVGSNFCFQWGFFQIFSTCTSKRRQPASKQRSCAQGGTLETSFWRCIMALNAPQLLTAPSQPGCSCKDSPTQANRSQISLNTRSLQPHHFQSLPYAMQDGAPAEMLCWKEPCKMQQKNPICKDHQKWAQQAACTPSQSPVQQYIPGCGWGGEHCLCFGEEQAWSDSVLFLPLCF